MEGESSKREKESIRWEWKKIRFLSQLLSLSPFITLLNLFSFHSSQDTHISSFLLSLVLRVRSVLIEPMGKMRREEKQKWNSRITGNKLLSFDTRFVYLIFSSLSLFLSRRHLYHSLTFILSLLLIPENWSNLTFSLSLSLSLVVLTSFCFQPIMSSFPVFSFAIFADFVVHSFSLSHSLFPLVHCIVLFCPVPLPFDMVNS